MAETNFDEMRSRRNFDMNPPENAPGQGGDGWDNLPIGSSGADFSVSNGGFDGNLGFDGGSSGMDINSTLNGGGSPFIPGSGNQPTMPGGMLGIQGSMPGVQMGPMDPYGQQQPQKTFGEKVGESAEKAAWASLKGTYNFFKVFFKSFKNNTSADWYNLGYMMCKISIVMVIVSAILIVLGVFISSIHNDWIFIASCAIPIAPGFVLMAANRKQPVEQPAPVIEQPTQPAMSDDPFAEEGGYSFVDDSAEDMSESDWEMYDDSDDNSFSVNVEFSADSDTFNVSEAAESLTVERPGVYTRSYLIEAYSKVLPHINPSFAKMRQMDEGDNDFLQYEEWIKDAAYQTGVQGDKLDELMLQSAEKNDMILRLTVSRPTGIKEQEIANGFADCYKRQDNSGMIRQDRESVYAVVDTQVGKFTITLFLCNNVMVSLADLYSAEKDFISNPKVGMPLFWGINEYGRVFYFDGINAGNGSMLISGEGRSGKSWKGQSLIAQMTMFMSPAELEIYFFDKKDKVSDYYYLSTQLPHVRGFCGKPLEFVKEIKKIVDRETPKRQRMLLDAGVNNIKDYNKLNPNDKMSYIYIVVDEMASAMAEMDSYDKELHTQFDNLMIQVVTQLPYFGIRLMLFPHRIVNTIINKTVAQQISCRAVVGVLDFETLKAAVDIKTAKEFPYSLVKPGDMAIRSKDIRNGAATYTHSEVIGDSEVVNRRVFSYIGAVWSKLEPDYHPVVGVQSTTVGYNADSSNQDSPVKNSRPARDNSFKGIGDYAGAKPKSTVNVGSTTAIPADEIDWDSEPVSSSEEDNFWKNFGGN